MDADGSHIRRVRSDGTSPAWFPTGARIAFTGYRSGELGIYTMNADGSSVTRLTHDIAGPPVWAPDGTSLLFSMLLAAAELMARNADATRDDIRDFISGNYCRCTGYQAIVDAIETTMRNRKQAAGKSP